MTTKKALAVTVVTVSIFNTACATLGIRAQPVSVPASSEVGQSVRDLYQAAGVTIPAKGATATLPATIDPAEFAQAGYRIVFTECNQYFDAIVKADNRLKMTKADVTAAGSAAAVITTLAQGTSKSIGIVAAVFGLGAVVIDNLDQYSFATPYPTQTRGLILKALAAYRQSSAAESAKSISDAADLIAGYANLCTYSGIAELAAESITKATPGDVSNAGPLFTDAQKATLQPIGSILGLAAGTQISDADYVLLAVFADPTTDGKYALLDAIAPTFTSIPDATVTSKIYDRSVNPHQKQAATLKSIWSILSPLMTSDAQFGTQVAGKKKAADGGAPPKKQVVIGVL